MIIYNVTTNIEKAEAERWLKWMLETHIPQVMETGMFLDYTVCRLIGDDDSDGFNYVIQYKCESMEIYKQYIKQFAPALREDVIKLFGDKFIAYRSLLEVIK